MANNAVCVQNIVMGAAVLTLLSGYFKGLPGMLGGKAYLPSFMFTTIWIRSSCLRRQCASHQL
jgi:hypothetical protein